MDAKHESSRCSNCSGHIDYVELKIIKKRCLRSLTECQCSRVYCCQDLALSAADTIPGSKIILVVGIRDPQKLHYFFSRSWP